MKKVIFVLAIIMIILIPSIINDKEIINNKQYNNSNYSCQQVNLKDTLKGKKLSILGDSISTYDGYSNNPNIYNMSTLNNKYYPKGEVNNVEETWWMQFAISTGMSVLVNNSYSGSRVYATSSNVDYYYQPAGFQDLRAKNLHNKSGINPDVIAIYMGTNDFRQSVELGTHDDTSYNIIKNNNGTYSYETPKSFVDAYIIMLHKIKTKYPNAEIFCFTLPKNSSNHSDETLQNYNVIIEEIAQHFGVNIVNLYDSEIILTNTYYLDLQDEQNHIHPNVKGMTVIKDKFEEKVASITKYYNEAGVSVTKEEYEKSCGTGKITINNMDSNNQHLKGTKIKVIGTKGYSNTFTTTGSSLIVENLKYDTYKINVIESPEGYILVPEQSITLSGTNSNITTNIINKKNKIKISKVDSTGEKIVEGATLQLTDSEGNIVNICKDINGNKNVECTWISANTPYEIEGLSKGTYYLKEIKSPDGYVLNNEKVKIVIDEKTVEDSYEIGNKLNKIVISNLSADTKKQLEGITLQLHDSNGNIVKKCKDTKGNNNIECMWVSSNVPYEIRGLKKGTYYLVETKVPSGYQLNKQKVKFVVDGNKNIYEVEMIHQLEVFEVDVPDTLSAKSILLITIAMTLVAIGIGVIVYIKKYKVN